MNTSRTLRFGAFVASMLLAALVTGGLARAATTATTYAQDTSGWHPTSLSIDPGGTVTWENRDPNYNHPVECVQADSNAPCPWSGAKTLDHRQGLTNSKTSQTFPKAGTYAFRCAIHTSMTGTVVVGSGQPAPSSTPSSTPRHSATPKPTTHASVTPTQSASVAPSSTTKSKGALKPRSTARARTSAAPSVLAAGPTAAKKDGPGAAASVPAAILIALVVGAHIVRARRRTA